jgi:hypothetical protein
MNHDVGPFWLLFTGSLTLLSEMSGCMSSNTKTRNVVVKGTRRGHGNANMVLNLSRLGV